MPVLVPSIGFRPASSHTEVVGVLVEVVSVPTTDVVSTAAVARPDGRRERHSPSPMEVAVYVEPMSYLRSLTRLDQRLMPGLRQPGETAEDFLRRTARMFRFKYSDVGRALREHFEHLDAERRQNE